MKFPWSRTEARGPAATAASNIRRCHYLATVVAPEHQEISFARLFHAIRTLAPESEVGTWSDPKLSAPPAIDPGCLRMTLDGQRFGVIAKREPVPAEFFQIGPFTNLFMRDPASTCRGHRAHVNIMGVPPTNRGEAFLLSRAVTIAARAVAGIVYGTAIKWADADHIVPPKVIDDQLEKLVPKLGIAPDLWSRLLVADGPPTAHGRKTSIVGTVGLHAFSIRDLEYNPSTRPIVHLLQHAALLSATQMGPLGDLKDGWSIGGPNGFRADFQSRGLFLDTAIARITLSD